jgi:polyisoprenoid-binding protein YceI
MLILLLGGMVISSCGDVGDAPKAKTGEAVEVTEAGGGTYLIDTARSDINWKAAKVTKAHDGGFGTFEGTLTVDDSDITGAKIMIESQSIWSDSERLTGHLKSNDFFVVDSFPTATFEASSFQPISGDTSGATHSVTGNLAMRGNTKSVTFPAKVEISGNEVKAYADFTINRKDWGIIYPGAPDDLIEDEVRIIFDITAVKQDVVAVR